MESIISPELEQIRYEKLKHIRIFINSIMFRAMHEHSAFEIDIILKGSANIRSGRGAFMVHPGSLLIFNSYEPHEITAEPSETLQILAIQVSNSFCESYCPRLHNVSFLTPVAADTFPSSDRATLRDRIFAVALSYLEELPFFELRCVGEISLLLSDLLRLLPYEAIPDSAYVSQKNKSARVRRITNYIDKHYREKISLAVLAEQEGITPTHLSHIFKEAFHVSFQEYLNALRLEKALVLMKNPDVYLVDICLDCGFSDTRYLNRMFQKEFGCTATEYRQRLATSKTDNHIRSLPSAYAEYSYDNEESLSILREAMSMSTCRNLHDKCAKAKKTDMPENLPQ